MSAEERVSSDWSLPCGCVYRPGVVSAVLDCPAHEERPEPEQGALAHVMATYPRSMDLPTVLWGASAALLAMRQVNAPDSAQPEVSA